MRCNGTLPNNFYAYTLPLFYSTRKRPALPPTFHPSLLSTLNAVSSPCSHLNANLSSSACSSERLDPAKEYKESGRQQHGVCAMNDDQLQAGTPGDTCELSRVGRIAAEFWAHELHRRIPRYLGHRQRGDYRGGVFREHAAAIQRQPNWSEARVLRDELLEDDMQL